MWVYSDRIMTEPFTFDSMRFMYTKGYEYVGREREPRAEFVRHASPLRFLVQPRAGGDVRDAILYGAFTAQVNDLAQTRVNLVGVASLRMDQFVAAARSGGSPDRVTSRLIMRAFDTISIRPDILKNQKLIIGSAAIAAFRTIA